MPPAVPSSALRVTVGAAAYQPCSPSGCAGLTDAEETGGTRSEQSTRKYRNRAAVSASASSDTFRPNRTVSGSPKSSIGWAMASHVSPSSEYSGMYRPAPFARTRMYASRGAVANVGPAWMSASPSRVATYSNRRSAPLLMNTIFANVFGSSPFHSTRPACWPSCVEAADVEPRADHPRPVRRVLEQDVLGRRLVADQVAGADLEAELAVGDRDRRVVAAQDVPGVAQRVPVELVVEVGVAVLDHGDLERERPGRPPRCSRGRPSGTRRCRRRARTA